MTLTLTFNATPIQTASAQCFARSGYAAPVRREAVGASNMRVAGATVSRDCAEGGAACPSRTEMVVAALVAECLKTRRFDLF
jgi:hypothetical protein